MRRAPNWEATLLDAAGRRVGEPFVWGTSDCAALVRWAMAIIWGQDLWPEVAHWTTEREAIAAGRAHGTVAQMLAARGYQPVERWYAQTGDVVVEPEAFDGLGNAGVVLMGTHLLMTDATAGVTLERLRPDWPRGVQMWGWRG